MSNETKKVAVPQLRFPKFHHAGGWQEKKLGEIANFSKGKGISKSDIVHNGLLPCIRYGELYTYYNETINSVKSYTNLSPNDLILSQSNDVIIPASGETKEDIATASCVMKGGIALGGDLNIIRSKNNGVFLSYYLNNAKKHEIAQLAQGISVVHLYSGQLKKLNINLPEIDEQQKIADCLSSLDELIITQKQKLDILKTYKKGLMQRLFPQEGETVPQLRFPEFQNAEEWKKVAIGDKVNLLSGFPFKSEEISENSNGIPLMRGINVTEGYIRHNKDIDRFFIGDPKKLEKYRLDSNDLVIAMDGSKVGKNSALITPKDSGSLLIQRVARLRAKNLSTIQFIFQQINSRKFHAYVDRINTSSGIPHISASQINEFTLYFPNLPEQQKIVDCLSSLDELIVAQKQKLDALKTHKKGLMQQLFPN